MLTQRLAQSRAVRDRPCWGRRAAGRRVGLVLSGAARWHLARQRVRLGPGRRANAGGGGGVPKKGARRVEEGVKQLPPNVFMNYKYAL